MLLSFLAGYFEYVFLCIFIILFHELGHALAACILKLNVKEITIFMFGGVTTLEEDLNLNIIKEIVVLLMGPLFQIFLLWLVFNLNMIGYVNDIIYTKFYNINVILLSFNLLPILPLDGGRLINNILDLLLPYNLSHTITIIISYITLPIIFILDNRLFVIIIYIFLNVKLLEEIKSHKYRLNKLLLERKLKNYNFNKTIYIRNIKRVKRNKNYKIVDS